MDDKTFAEFFAGIGLVHAGLLSTGWECIYANDLDRKKHEMYEDLFGKSPYYHVGDIWETDKILSGMKYPVSLATASFPCVDLSLAGNRKGLAGKESGTFHAFIDILKALDATKKSPPMILIENVMGFLTSHDGNDFIYACQTLASLGYWIDCFMVDAKHFTPQSRPRLFIMGCKEEFLPKNALRKTKSLFPIKWADFIKRQTNIRPQKLIDTLIKLEVSTGLFCLPINDLPLIKNNIQDVIDQEDGEWWDMDKIQKHLDEMSPAHYKSINSLANNKFITSGTMYRRVREGKSRTEIRTDGLAGCLRTPRGGSSKQMVFVAGNNNIKMRWMLPKEYAALQGIPHFPINVGVTQALFGFGDAVCVPAIEWIASNYIDPIYNVLNKKEKIPLSKAL